MNVAVETQVDAGLAAFLASRDDAKIAHQPLWGQTVAACTGHKAFYLVARDGQSVHGVLPLVQIKSRLFGNRMISQALSTYGGPLADSGEATIALYDHATSLATERKCSSIEFRVIEPIVEGLPEREGKLCMYLPLTADPEELWKSFNAKVRNQVRKAEKSDITARIGGLEDLAAFYEVYFVRMHQLGSPPFPRKLMAGLLEAFPENIRVHTVHMGDECVGGGVVVAFNGFVEIPWAATRVEHNKLCPNNLLYWKVLEHHCQAGDRVFDFGRCSEESSTYRFKKQWGSYPVPLHYQYWVRPGVEFKPVNPESESFQKKVELWKKLPRWVVRLVGPRLGKDLL
jgi:FemAB-related protein (PEP-CTERM system-associated)